MLGADVLMIQSLGFFRAIRQDTLAFVAERQVNGGRDFLADRGVTLDLLADGFYRGVRPEKTVGQRLVFAQQPGGALGLAVLVSVAASRTNTLASSGDGRLSALTGGYHLAFAIGALFAVAAATVGAVFLRTGAVAAGHGAHEPQPVPAVE